MVFNRLERTIGDVRFAEEEQGYRYVRRLRGELFSLVNRQLQRHNSKRAQGHEDNAPKGKVNDDAG